MEIAKRLSAITAALVISTGLIACEGDEARPAEAANGAEQAEAATSSPRAARPNSDFEGTLQQIEVMLGADAIRSIAGTDDPEEILQVSPERVLEAVHSGEVDAQSIRESTMEIDGSMIRLQAEDEPSYTIVDGERQVAYTVDPQEGMIMVMDPDEMAEAAAGMPQQDREVANVERLGEREIRGYDATGFQVDMGDRIMQAWLSEELGRPLTAYYDVMFEVGAQLQQFGMGGGQLVPPDELREAGAAVRLVMVDKDQLGSQSAPASPFGGMMPAYTITEFYDLAPGDIADEQFALPEGFQRQTFGDLMGRMGEMMRDMQDN